MKTYSVELEKIYKYLKPAKLDAYVLDVNRPSILIFPGGGYQMVSDREAQPVALKFLNAGYNAFVLWYSTVDRMPDVHYPMQLTQALSAVKYIRENIADKRVIVCGFSAGGHLAAMTLTMYNRKEVLNAMGGVACNGRAAAAGNVASVNDLRPSAGILCYAVISSNPEYYHGGSFKNLTGSDEQSAYDNVSPDRFIDKNTPPAFIWHTLDDTAVPVENAFIFAKKLKEYNVPFALHIFESGVHGLSVCNKNSFIGNPDYLRPDIEKWTELCADWLNKRFGG